jgi:lipopolysaccharide transport system permease protein
MILVCWRNRTLATVLAKREVASRYKGSFLGVLWAVFNPVFMLSVYTFIFSVVFKARWGERSESQIEFAFILFMGMIIFNFFSECFCKAPSLILSNANYVKKVVFPLEILSLVSIYTAMFHFFISLSVWIVLHFVLIGPVSYTAMFLPAVMIPLCFITIGLSWVLASLGVYLRDVSQVVTLLTTVLMFLSPIFYPITAIPESFRQYLYFNPLMPSFEQARAVMIFGEMPDWHMLGWYLLFGICVSWAGFYWFQKTRKGFADVI